MNRFNFTAHLVKTLTLRLGYCLVIVLMTGCVTTAPVEKTGASGTVFYPALPNSPRIQYLATFSSSKDVVAPETGLAGFLLGEGEDIKYIQKPYGVQIYDGKIYAVDTRGPGYAVLDLVNQKFDFVGGRGGGRMQKPINITFDTDGSKYITDTGLNRVLVFDKNEQFVRALGFEGQFSPTDTAIADEKLFVVDIKEHEIEVLNKYNGALLYKIGEPGSGQDQIYHPTNIKVGPDNHLYITDTSNFRVQKFTQDGVYVRSFGSIGVNIGQFARPKGIALDRSGNLFVIDAAFENVQIVDPEGNLLMFFTGAGNYPDNINLPVDLEIDYDNVELFQGYAHPDFQLEFIILITSQYGPNKVNVYGYGEMKGMEYTDDANQSSTSN